MSWQGTWRLVALGVLAAACGGNVDGGTSSGGTSSGGTSSGGTSSGGTSSGGTSSGGTSSGGTSSGGSGGTSAPTCNGFADCCAKSCDLVVHGVQCPGTPNPDCGCNAPSTGGACVTRLTEVYRCVLKVGAQAVKCDKNGNLALRCGVCDAEMSAAAQVCAGSEFKCAY